jgi:hypothetical protein
VTLRSHAANKMICLFHFGKEDCAFTFNPPAGQWRLILDSADMQWHGSGGLMTDVIEGPNPLCMRPLSAAVYERMEQST